TPFSLHYPCLEEYPRLPGHGPGGGKAKLSLPPARVETRQRFPGLTCVAPRSVARIGAWHEAWPASPGGPGAKRIELSGEGSTAWFSTATSVAATRRACPCSGTHRTRPAVR